MTQPPPKKGWQPYRGKPKPRPPHIHPGNKKYNAPIPKPKPRSKPKPQTKIAKRGDELDALAAREGNANRYRRILYQKRNIARRKDRDHP